MSPFRDKTAPSWSSLIIFHADMRGLYLIMLQVVLSPTGSLIILTCRDWAVGVGLRNLRSRGVLLLVRVWINHISVSVHLCRWAVSLLWGNGLWWYFCERYVALTVTARQINRDMLNDTTVVLFCTVCGILFNVHFIFPNSSGCTVSFQWPGWVRAQTSHSRDLMPSGTWCK